jgi:putative transposase
MPWKECHIVDERLRFIARLLDGEKMAGLCAEFGISRKTGYKIYHRYKGCGIDGLTDRSRRPQRHANQLPLATERLIIRLKKEYPAWGAPKIRERLRRQYAMLPTQCPAISTVHAVLDRHGLVQRRSRRRSRAHGTTLTQPVQPNELWCADYKGEFMLANREYCYPLTITDFASRYLIACDALSTTKEVYAFAVFERAFKDFGLPGTIRTDNGVPFSSPFALYGLSKLAVWWLRLGIQIERIKPGHPEQNGRHERMHLTLKTEATKPAAANVLQQQGRFDAFVDRYNQERPHQALGMRVPSDLYTRSARPYRGLCELDYPFHDWTATVTRCGRICWNRRKINLSVVFAGQNVGVKQVSDRVWLVSFMDYDLGYFDDETCRLEPIENPFGPKVLPMSPE